MAITPINSSAIAAAAAPTSAATVAPRPVNRDLAAAVKVLNDNEAAGQGRQFSIAIDPKARVAVVRIIDSKTNELIEQIPSQYILDLAQQLTGESASNNPGSSR